MRTIVAGVLLSAIAQIAGAQTEAVLRQKLEGQRVVLQIDMPATSEGVDVYPGSSRPLDFGKYANRVKSNGIAIQMGESSMITKVKVKDDLIEIHLGGGGYGTLGDALGSFLGNTAADSGMAQQAKIANERAQRAASGSRFNLRFPNGVSPDDLTPEAVSSALQKYASLPSLSPRSSAVGATVTAAVPAAANSREAAPEVSAPTSSQEASELPAMPKKGMSLDELQDIAGKPRASKANGPVTTYTHDWADGVLEADFFNHVLVAYRITSG